ncbi:hypothetical protein LCGC14_0224240 [marine sediment metagenome]|uniref:Uncharacterized protein n=1 Tax=marine sediment metagenome TaxID=412755 RepID=A0A0F9WWT8_9ZZZZ
MVRQNRISVGFNSTEYDKIVQRANKAHLKIADYIRWHLFSPTGSIQQQVETKRELIIPYKAAPEVIERIKAGKEAYIAPYQQARLDNMKIFSKSGGIGELHNSIKMRAHGSRVLKPIPKKDIKQKKKWKEERRHIANKHLLEIKQKNIEAGIING